MRAARAMQQQWRRAPNKPRTLLRLQRRAQAARAPPLAAVAVLQRRLRRQPRIHIVLVRLVVQHLRVVLVQLPHVLVVVRVVFAHQVLAGALVLGVARALRVAGRVGGRRRPRAAPLLAAGGFRLGKRRERGESEKFEGRRDKVG